MVCIIDDREDVWQGCGNLVQVKPYHFFRHTGDIHAPPGLAKRDQLLQPKFTNFEDNNDVENRNERTENGTSSLETKEEESETVAEKSSDKKEDEVEVKEGKEVEKSEAETKDEAKTDGTDEEEIKEESKNETETSEKSAKKDEPLENNVEKDLEIDETPLSGDKVEAKEAESGKSGEVNEEEKKDKDTEGEEFKDFEKMQELEDHDDYLLYLEDILRRIHAEFYNKPEADTANKNLRDIIPRVRARVLKGLRLTFSGMVATHQKLHQSRAYKVARALGAEVSQVRRKIQ